MRLKKEIPSITNLGNTTALNVKINEVKNKIPNINNIATTTTRTAVENKIPNVSALVKKKRTITQKLVKLKGHKYITVQEFNKLTTKFFTARLAQASLVSKDYIANFVKKTDLNKN